MEIINEKDMVVEKIGYRTKCRFCDTKIELEGKDLRPVPFPMTFEWKCPICCFTQTVFYPKLKTQKVTHYKVEKT